LGAFGESKLKKVFANGCFDLLHPGHLSLLEYCSTLGRVIVGLNSDDSVLRLKGSGRPIMNQEQRLMALKSCRFVDEVHIFEEDTPIELIRKIKPDLIVKGSEYIGQDVVGQEIASVAYFRATWDVSTSMIINKIREGIS